MSTIVNLNLSGATGSFTRTSKAAQGWVREAGKATAMPARTDSEADAIARVGHDPAKRIADVQQKLKQLLLRAQRAALLGDKRAAAALAKEASGLARELAEAVHDAKAQGQQVPDGGSDAIYSYAASTPDSAPPPAAQPLVPKQPDPTIDPGLLKEIEKTMILLRGVMGLARATIRRQGRAERARKDNATPAQALKDLEAAELEMEKAAESIQTEISSPGSGAVTQPWFSFLA